MANTNTHNIKGKVIVVVGPTGSGKTDFAIKLALEDQLQYEFVNTDSQQAYKELSIGNNKGKLIDNPLRFSHPTFGSIKARAFEDLPDIPLWLTDVFPPTNTISVADYQSLARPIIEDILSRGKTPILVGGSGLYTLAVISDYQFEDYQQPNPFKDLPLESLIAKAEELKIDLGFLNSSDRKNPRRLQNYLYKHFFGLNLTREEPNLIYDCKLILLDPPLELLETKLRARAEQMVKEGIVEEVERLIGTYGVENISMNIKHAAGYRQVFNCDEDKDRMRLVEEIYTSHRQLAKKQQTWNRKYFLHLNAEVDVVHHQ